MVNLNGMRSTYLPVGLMSVYLQLAKQRLREVERCWQNADFFPM
jgi:hypothetical protein